MIRVYKYGLLYPTSGDKLVWNQIEAANTYRNTLNRIECDRRDALREAEAKVGDLEASKRALDEAKSKLVELLRPMSRARNSSTRGSALSPSERAGIVAQRAVVAECRSKWFDLRKRLLEDETLVRERDAINARALIATKAARAATTVWWGTYTLVEAAMDAAKKMPLWDDGRPNDPRYVRRSAYGAVGVQDKGNVITTEMVMSGASTILRIMPPADGHSCGCKEGNCKHARLAIRVGSDAHRNPVWAEFPMVLHRPLPPNGRVKCATVTHKQEGPRSIWSVCITVDEPDETARRESCGVGVIGIDIGWRRVREGVLRVAAWSDGSDSGTVELLLGPDTTHGGSRVRHAKHGVEDGLEKAAYTEGRRDDEFNALKEYLVAFERTHKASHPGVLDSVVYWPKDVAKCKSKEKMRDMVDRWFAVPFDGDQDAYIVAEAWARHDWHLHGYSTGQRARALARRREQYRVFGARMARRYDTVVFEDFDLRAFSAVTPVEKGETVKDRRREVKTICAPSEFVREVSAAFVSRGGRVVKVGKDGTSTTCSKCGAESDIGAGISFECRVCGRIVDRDLNASENIRLRGLKKVEEQMNPPKQKESKRERIARLVSAKEARK